MASDKKKQLLFCGIGVVVLAIVAVYLMNSGGSNDTPQTRQPNRPVVRDTDSDLNDDTSSVATRSAPTVDRSGSGRLAGASDDGAATDEDADEDRVAEKTKRRKKGRPRKKQSRERDEEEEATKQGSAKKVIPRPF